jgi:hypothetical protein
MACFQGLNPKQGSLMLVSRYPYLRAFAALLCLMAWISTAGAYTQGNLQTASDGTIETIPLEATVQASPPQIRIKTYAPGTFSIYRKTPDVVDWGVAVATGVTLAGEGVWTDSTVSVGTLYEYRFVNTAGTTTNSIYPSGYILCGINVDGTQPRGRMAVVVASDVLTTLPAEFAQYKADLVADGWTVHEVPVPRAPNYSALGNGNILTVKINAGGTGYVNSDYVTLTNASGKTARGKLTVTSGAITGISIPNGGGGAGFSVNDALTLSGGTSTGTGAQLLARVDNTVLTLVSADAIVGGSGYTSGQTVTFTGQTSGKTAQATIFAYPGSAIYTFFSYVTLQPGFIQGEKLTMTGNTTGSGVGNIFADYVDTQGNLMQAGLYATGSGYTQDDSGTLTGQTSGKTAQVKLDVDESGVIRDLRVVSSQSGFVNGENLVLSGTSTGSGAPLFTATAGGPILSVQVNAGGSGYVNGNVVGFNYGTTGALGVLNVTNGVITSITLTSPGAGYVDNNYVYLTGLQANSSGANVSVLTVDNTGVGLKVNVTAGGSGYRENDRVTITGTTSGATATGSLIAPAGSVTGISVVLPATFAANEALTLAPASGGSGATATASSMLANFHLLIRDAVQAINNAYPGELKNLALIGKVPVARSGLSDGAGADGHGNVAPYGTDAFYADTDGVIGSGWTDTGYNDGSSATNNLVGDGQFDQRKISEVGPNGRVELGFGRVDLSLGIQTETEALRTYFGKLHRYKVASPDFQPGRRVVDRLTYPNEREAQLQSMPGVVGMNNVEFITNSMLPRVKAGQDADQLYTTQNGPYLFFFKGNGGPSGGVGGRAVFWTGMQSHWGYWYESYLLTSSSNIMQESLSEDSFTLSYTWNIWGLRYIYHRMGMGFDAGDMMKQSINNRGWTLGATGGPYTYKFNNTSNGDYHGSLYMNHMGDPALRLFMFEPPSALSVVKTGGNPVLTWTASPNAQVVGYHVYRAAHSAAPFTRLTSTPISSTTYTDTGVTAGSYAYLVRAVRLETTGGGTFYNASLGATQSINLDTAPTAVAIATTALPAFNWNSAGSVTLSAQGGVPQYAWSLASGSLPAGLALSGAGVLSGTPTATGFYSFTVQVADQVGQTATRAFTLTVNANSAAVLYPEATTYTDKAKPTASFGTDEVCYISGTSTNQYESFLRYDLSALPLNNSFVRATLCLYVTSGTTTGAIANVRANLVADSLDGWIDRGISRPFTGVGNNGSGKTRIACPGHGFTNGTQVSLAGLTGTGAPANGPYAITVVDADTFDLLTVNYASWTYDPALAFVSTTSMTYNTRPTTYNTSAPTLTATGVNTPGTLLQLDVTSYVRATLANDPLKKLSVRLFTSTLQTVAVGSANAYGAARPYIVFETTNAPDIAVNSPLASPACIYAGSSILLSTTVTPLPNRAASLSLQWTKVSGPGSVTFTNATSASTGAAFGAPGDYVLRLTANDGVDQSLRDIAVRVLSTPVTGPYDGNLKLRLALDETGGTAAADSSGISPAANGTLVGTPAWDASGRIGGGLGFTGSLQRVEVADSSANANPLDGFNKLTISLWLKATSLPAGGSAYAGVITKRLGAFNKESYRIELRGGSPNASIYVTVAGGTSLVGLTTVTTNQWYHLCVVYDGSLSANNLQLYVNGSPDRFSTITPTTIPRNNASPLKIGSNDLYDFLGTIDEVRIYNRALAASEVQDLAAATPANMGPVVNAGAPVSGNAGDAIALSGSVIDDGNPAGSSLILGWSKSTGPGAAAFGNAGSAATTANFNQAGAYTLTLSANDGAITTYAQTTASISAVAGIDAWRMTHFGTTDATGIRADNASAANDGMANLLKYALGLNPNLSATAASAGLILQVQAGEGGNYLSYTFTGTASDVTYVVEATGDLAGSWTALYTHSGSAPGTVRVDDTQPLSSVTKRFLRLRVTRP